MPQEYTAKDIVRSAYEGDATGVRKALDHIMLDKMSTAIDARRAEVVSDVFGSSKGEE